MSLGSYFYFFFQMYCLYPNTGSKMHFVKSCLNSNFMKEKDFFTKAKKVCKSNFVQLMLLFDIFTLNGRKMKKDNF